MPESPSVTLAGRNACLIDGHRPSRTQTSEDGVRRTHCRCCGLRLMRTAISRRWIIADRLG